MRFRPNVSAVAAIAVLTATTFQLGGAALAHAPHSPLFGHHFVPPPPPPGPPTLKAVPTDNVKDFGAKGDGTTDDTAAINKAVTDAKANNKVVLFPAGKFFHTATLTFSGVAVTGVGSSSILLANPSNEENTAVILSGQSASITNMTVSTQGVVCGDDGFPEANEGAITISAATSFTVKNVTLVQGQNTTGVFVTGSNGGSVSAVSDNGFGSGVAPEAGV